VKGLTLAVRYLTIVPVPGRRLGRDEALGAAAPWFPVVGLLLGAAVVVTDVVATQIFPPLLVALLTVTAWKLLTGGLHLDGLADCLDGLVGRDPEHRLAIMRDSRIGSFGAIGLILFLLLEVGAVSELAPPLRWRALLVAPAVARATPALLGRLFPDARAEGHGAAFRATLRPLAAPVALAAAAVAALGVLRATGLVGLAFAWASAVVVGRFMVRRLRGITGDVLGAAVETAELVLLLAVIAWTRAR
jgi:adenosylcobinamide-GDP ribazoletransferase